MKKRNNPDIEKVIKVISETSNDPDKQDEKSVESVAKFIESPESINYSIGLLKSGQINAQIVACNIIINYLSASDSQNIELQNQIRNFAFSHAQSYDSIINKQLITIVAMIAIKDFPEKWPSFLDEVLSSPVVGLQILHKYFTLLVDENTKNIAPSRFKQIQTFFIKKENDLVNLINSSPNKTPKKYLQTMISNIYSPEMTISKLKSSNKSPKRQTTAADEFSERNKDAISQLHTKIQEKERNIDFMMNEIAKIKNDLESRKLGFDGKVQRKREEMKNRYKAMIEELQSRAATQLAENELLTSKISEITSKINDIVNAPINVKKVKLNFDFSKNTEKLLKEREKEIREQCSKEFYPFFLKLQQEHEENIESLEIEHENEIKRIHEAAFDELKIFKPRVFISQEEIAARQKFEKIQNNLNSEYEIQKNALLKQISEIETDRDNNLQQLFEETKQKIQNEKSFFSKRRKIVRQNVKNAKSQIPQQIEVPKLSPEEEKNLRLFVEQKLKSDFEKQLESQVNNVQENRENMVKEMKEMENNEIKKASENNDLIIYNLDNEISDLDEELLSLNQELEKLKLNYENLSAERSSNEDNFSQMRGEKLYYADNLRDLEAKLLKYNFEEEEEESQEVLALQSELEKFSHEIDREKKNHLKLINSLVSQHESTKNKISSRAEELFVVKDQAISQLKLKINETKKKIKEIHSEVTSLVN
ncbi:hypothetical protein TVAG_067470 [Trichomonas vaginalis G3]|uniref:Uncharacterized protein n=1 Tax=Trichomonas vaginalis (strain ATCC PRA-98 / G3) TaxID=412133 RepID=A2DSG3_TRIV3|nr:nuclear export signal receptor protein [Trichomonas vaginalis G3]EAY16742.1 hypothetical protein TVAG_067470 [Trichomonas vaginalis G3]KAI5543183.1 nuclear export signal receptor protein [Trichomonas vaginalis G3]|eukprot:XP_001328965.1 hypothetical protein [Trichomonas vaginalis G3]